MAFINQPPDLRALQADTDTRLRKLETAVRFTAPNVTTDPVNARTGDIWYNTATNTLKALLTTVVTLVQTGVANTFTALQTFTNGLTVSGGNLTATAVTSNLGVTNTGNLGVTGTTTLTGTTTANGAINGQVSGTTVITMSNDANGSIELGKVNGATSTPFIDFHSGATAVDFDARIIGSGGTGASGGGTLELNSNRLTMTNVNVNLASITTATTVGAAGAASALPANPVGYIIIEIGGTQRKIPYYNI
jgi:hypothetical protein